ncbi:MAG: zinc ribbon domain-containing protein [Atribacterota bacterium]|nr:zinc ribbon domain-containing protein [Atribacterota bacterium]
MPTYEYQCKKCGHVFEKFQSIKANPLKKCPKCDGEVCRLISKNGSFILKGSGYYSTDNRKSSIPKDNKLSTSKKTEKNNDKAIAEGKSVTGKTKKETASTNT